MNMRTYVALLVLICLSNRAVAQFEGNGGGVITGVDVSETQATAAFLSEDAESEIFAVSGSASFVASQDSTANVNMITLSTLEIGDLGASNFECDASMSLSVAPGTVCSWSLDFSSPGPAPSAVIPLADVPGLEFYAVSTIAGGGLIDSEMATTYPY